MKFRLFILLMCCLPGIVQAFDGGGGKDKDKDKCKERVKCKENTVNPTVEELVFVVPPSPAKNKVCLEKKAFRSSVIDFYKWYLQHENLISAGLAKDNRDKDMIPPFNISWQTLHAYFQFIQKTYPSWIDEIEGSSLESNSGIDYNAAKGIQMDKRPAVSPKSNFSNTIN